MRHLKKYALSIWTTNGCNLKCKYCFYESAMPQPVETMNPDTALAVAKFIEASGISSVTFFGGEPLVNWEALETIVRAVKRPIKWFVTTNGTLLDEERLKFMKEYGFHINLSFDGLPDTQNQWRDGSYDAVVSKIDLFKDYPSLGVLKTLVDPGKLFDDVVHIKELGFKNVFINLLDPFGHTEYDIKDLPAFRENYKKVIALHGNGIQINDFVRWKELIGKHTKPGCGFTGMGLGVSPDGKLYPCHQGPSLPEWFSIGDVWKGIDEVKERQIRNVPNPASCVACPYGLSKCPVTMWNKHKRFGVEAPEWYRLFELAKIRVIEEACGLESKTARCFSTKKMLLCTLVDDTKYYLLKPFLTSLTRLQSPVEMDYVLLVDQDDKRLLHALRLWISGKLKGIPEPPKIFSTVKLIEVPIVPLERFMFRIARARNMALGIARKGGYDYLCFLDADVLAPFDGIEKLLSVDAGMVGALVKCRRDDREGWYNNYVRKEKGFRSITDFKPGDVLEVDATGSDYILIKREVFVGSVYEYKPEIPEAEDMGFCFKATEKGFKVKIHTGVVVKHIEPLDVEVKM